MIFNFNVFDKYPKIRFKNKQCSKNELKQYLLNTFTEYAISNFVCVND